MTPTLKIAAALVAILIPVTAQAKHHKHQRHSAPQTALGCVYDNSGHMTCSGGVTHASAPERGRVASVNYDGGRVVGGRPAGCPHAYCGCGVSLHIFGRIIPELNLALNWRRFTPAMPAAGMVAYRSGHVFAIESVIDSNTVVAYDPNSGHHLTRIHTISLRGFHVVDPHSSRVAANY